MSSTNKTATIELSQYVGTDKPTYLVDYNGDMLKIDNAIAADRDSITTAQNTADGAVTKADANKGSIDVINTQLNGDPEVPGDSGLSGDVTAIEGVVNTVTSLIGTGSPTTSEQTIIGAINGLEATIAPREDGLLMANSYTVGKQFARGGTVYEVLQSITAGTAFASLILNTDYKVADTLVEQIANGGTELPTGLYLKEKNHKIQITAESGDTVATVLASLATACLTYIQSLSNKQHVVATFFSGKVGSVPCNAFAYPNSMDFSTTNWFDNSATDFLAEFLGSRCASTQFNGDRVVVRTSSSSIWSHATIGSGSYNLENWPSQSAVTDTPYTVSFDVYEEF